MIENWGSCNSTGVTRMIAFKAGLVSFCKKNPDFRHAVHKATELIYEKSKDGFA